MPEAPSTAQDPRSEQIAQWQTTLRSTTDSAQRIQLLEDIGTAQCILKDEAAVQSFEEAVQLAKESGSTSAETLNTVRLAAAMQHLNTAGALTRFQEALDLCRQQIAPDACLQSLGEFYVKLGRDTEAIPLFEQVLTLRQVTGNIAQIEVTQRSLAEARKRIAPPAEPVSAPAEPESVTPPLLPDISLIERVSYRSFAVAQIAFFGLMLVVIGLDGFSNLDVIAVLVLLVLSVLYQRGTRSRQTDDIDHFEQLNAALKNGAKYTLVELYGTYCAGCAAMNPFLDSLEGEGNPRLQILRLNIEHPPGQYLKPEKNTFTPLFQLYDPQGQKIRETYLVLDRARILYDVERLTRGSGPLTLPPDRAS